MSVTDAYDRACAVTGEHSLPALEAAHIRSYAKAGPHDVRNGILLRADLHRLFDKGYITVMPELRLEVSGRLRADYSNGRPYYPLHGRPLRIPAAERDRQRRDHSAYPSARRTRVVDAIGPGSTCTPPRRHARIGALGDYISDPERKAKLLARTCVASKPWYAFHENPPLPDMLRPKILCKDIGAVPLFTVDYEGTIVPRHSVYYIVPAHAERIDELADYLNSESAAHWLRDHCQRAANGFLRLQSHVLKTLPLLASLESLVPQMDLALPGSRRRSA